MRLTAMPKTADIELRLLSRVEYVGVARAAAESLALQIGFGEQGAAHVALAVAEALSNIMRHGYCGKPDHPIWLDLTPEESDGRTSLLIVIEDECHGVDLDKIKSRPLYEVRPGGLGVHIIQEVMDDVKYCIREGNRGVRLTIRKFVIR